MTTERDALAEARGDLDDANQIILDLRAERNEARERASRAEALLQRWIQPGARKDWNDLAMETGRILAASSAAPGPPWVPAVGDRVRLRVGAAIMQDHSFPTWPHGGYDPETVFTVKSESGPFASRDLSRVSLVAHGFGLHGADGSYGNGAIYADAKDCLPATPAELLAAGLPATDAGGESLAEKAATFWEERCRQAERERGEWMNAALHTRLCRADLDVSTPDLYRREQSIAASALVEDVERFKRERDALERRPCPDLLAVNHGDSVTFHGRKVTFHVERLDAPPARPTPGADVGATNAQVFLVNEVVSAIDTLCHAHANTTNGAGHAKAEARIALRDVLARALLAARALAAKGGGA